MLKQWVTVYRHKGYDIQILNGAEINDSKDYRVIPTINDETYITVGDAITAIDKHI